MKNIINKHYSSLRLSPNKNSILFDLNYWYKEPYERHYGIPDLNYRILAFIRVINTSLHLRIAKRLSLGLDVYGKET